MLKRLAIFILSSVYLFAPIWVLAVEKVSPNTPEQRIPKTESSHKRQEQPNSESANQSPAPTVTSSPQPPAPTCDEACQQGRENLKIQNRLSLFTALLVLVGFLQVISMAWQAWWMGRQTGRITRQAVLMNRQNVLMRASLKLMETANEINRESLQAVQRPYISFPYFENARSLARILNPETGNTIWWKFSLPVENGGTTPAINVLIRVNWIATELEGIPQDFKYDDVGEFMPSPVFIAAKTRIFTYSMEIPYDRIVEVHQRRKRLFFYGWTTYQDMFGNTPIHRTEFCYEVIILHLSGSEIGLECRSLGPHDSAT